MAEYLLSDVELAISKLPETAINTPFEATADFAGFLAAASPPAIPQPETVNDAEMVGDGTEFAKDVRLYYWGQNAYTIAGKLNTEIAAILFRRALGGGTVTNTVITAAASWDHTFIMRTSAEGREPLLSTILMPLGGADFLWASMAVQTFSVSQQGAAEPQFSAEMIGTGFHKRLADVTPAIVMPTPGTQHYMHGAALVATLNDGSAVDLSALGRVRSINATYNQNLVLGDRRPGDPFITPADRRSGAYARRINRGRRSGNVVVKMNLDETLEEYDWLTANTNITSLKLKWVGDPIGATAEAFEFEWIVPKSRVGALVGDSEGDDASVTLTFEPLVDTVSGGIITGRTRDATATLT